MAGCIFLSASLWGQEDASTSKQNDSRQDDSFSSISVLPKTFWFFDLGQTLNDAPQKLNITMKPSLFASYEGGFSIRKTGLSFNFIGGASDVENTYHILALLGYHNFALRFGKSDYTGTASWIGIACPGLPSRFSFTGDFNETALLYRFKTDLNDPKNPVAVIYVGIGYVVYNLPTQIDAVFNATADYNSFGNPTYNKNMTFKYPEFIIGYDSLDENLSLGKKTGFSSWVNSELTLGSGSITIDNATAQRLGSANPNRVLGGESFNESYLSIKIVYGLQWVGTWHGCDVGAGLGASLHMLASYDFETHRDDEITMYPYVSTDITQLSPIVKASIRW